MLRWSIKIAFIGDGTKLASYNSRIWTTHTMIIYDTVGLAAQYRNAIHRYEPVS